MLTENENVQKKKEMFFLQKAKTEGRLSSPIDLSLRTTTPMELMDNLQWDGLEEPPEKMKLTNSGKSVVVTGRWSAHRPILTGGFLPDGYVLSQVHFHWGQADHEGSEHKVNGASFPMEMHILLYRACYRSHSLALTYQDGVVVLAYLVELGDRSTPGLQWLTDHLPAVVQANSSAALPPSPFSSLVLPFTGDYLAYWGAVNTDRCSHSLLWLVSCDFLTITSEDLQVWRTIHDIKGRPINETFSATHSSQGRTLFHVNPSPHRPHLLSSMAPVGQVQKTVAPRKHSSKDVIKMIHPPTSLSDTFVCNHNKGMKMLDPRSCSNQSLQDSVFAIRSLQTSPEKNQKRLSAETIKRLENQRKETENNVIARPIKTNKKLNVLQKKPRALKLQKKETKDTDLLKHNVPKRTVHGSKKAKQIIDKSVSPKKNDEQYSIQMAKLNVDQSSHTDQRVGQDVEKITNTKQMMKSRLPITKQKSLGSEPQSLTTFRTNYQTDRAKPFIQCSPPKPYPENMTLHPHWVREDLTTTIPRPSLPRPLSSAVQSPRTTLRLTSQPQTSNSRLKKRNIGKVEIKH